MKLEKVYQYQLFLYVFIIVFGIQNAWWGIYFFDKWSWYENLGFTIFIISVLTVLISVVLLIVESIKTLNRKEINKKEIAYLITNVILYYIVIGTSLYLSTQVRF